MPMIPASSDARGWRLPSLWKSAATVAVVMTVLATTTAAATYGGTSAQERATLKFLKEFPDEFESLERTWTGTDFCSWPGVTCYGKSTVDVNLAGMSLVGDMPEFDDDVDGSLVTIRSIDLSGNPGISDDFEEDWKHLTLLERLDLSGTSLVGELPSNWDNMRSLTYLNISGSSACRSLPSWSPSKLANLKVVDFSRCNFRGTLPSSWGGFSSITEAYFDGNSFCGCIPSSWGAGSVLTTAVATAVPDANSTNCAVVNRCGSDANQCNLVLSPQQNTLRFLREIADEFDDQLERLWTGTAYCSWAGVTCNSDGTVEVNLSGFNLDGDMPEIDDDIDGAKVLVTVVNLSNNPRLDGDFEEDWGRLKQLRVLNLSNTALQGSLPYAWNGMSALEELDVHSTAACKSLPDWQLPKLSVVDLSYSSFYGSLRSSWAAMDSLTAVNLAGNDFCGCVPSSWAGSAVDAAVTGLSAAVTSSSCAVTNMCGFSSSKCSKTSSGGGGAGGGGMPTTSDATLEFLREFADELSPLHAQWTGTDYCSWTGVTCHDNGTVSINLSGRGLYGDMPELDDDVNGANVNVISIDLSNNPGIRDNFESSWGGLKQLEYLDLSNTSLYGNIPDAWNGMTALREIHVRNTAACRNLPNWNAWAMQSLRVVDFSYNNMAGSLPSSWSLFSQLESVDFSGNSFCGCVPVAWSKQLVDALGSGASANSTACAWLNTCSSTNWRCTTVPNSNTGGSAGGAGSGSGTTTTTPPTSTLLFLRALSVALGVGWSGDSYCNFSGVTCSTVDGVEMASVDLSNRSLSGSYLPSVSSAINGARVFVTKIDLSGNSGISGSFPESWSALKQVQVINLSGTSLRGDIPDSWNGMSSLEEVYISNTLACRSMPNWGSSLTRLRIVDFSGNANMRGVLTSSFASLSALTSLNLQGTNFCGCVPASWSRKSVLTSAASAAGVPTSGCLRNACMGLNFVCPSTVTSAPPSPAEDPTLRLLRRIAAALAVLFGHRAADDGLLNRASLPSGQTLEQNWTGDDYCNNWVGVTCDLDTGAVALNLSGTGLSGQLPSLADLATGDVALTSIDFSSNPDITGTFPPSWGNLKSLRTLRLHNLSIASSLPKQWDGMTALEELTVSNTQACGELPAWSANGLQNLRALDLSQNLLSGTLPTGLGAFTTSQLENFTLAGNKGICGCAPSSWGSAALLDGASSVNVTMTSVLCDTSSVPCTSQPACVAAIESQGDGGVRTASVLVAWLVAAFLAIAML